MKPSPDPQWTAAVEDIIASRAKEVGRLIAVYGGPSIPEDLLAVALDRIHSGEGQWPFGFFWLNVYAGHVEATRAERTPR